MKLVITDERIPEECLDSLKALGFTPFLLKAHERLSPPVASHTDMLLFKHKSAVIAPRAYLDENPSLRALLRSMRDTALIESDADCGDSYPEDAIFNAAIVGDSILAKTDTVSRDILSYARKIGATVIHTRQGYPACTVLTVDERHAITSDVGTARILRENGIDVLIVKNTSAIRLPPYEYGFIGGCAGVYGRTVYFVGSIGAHPECEKILSFINNIGLEALSLAPSLGFLADVGGLAFIDCDTDDDGDDGKE